MDEQQPTAAEVHASACVIDGHADTPQRFADEAWDFNGVLGHGMLSLETARRGGLHAEFFAVWVEPSEWSGRYAERTFALIESVLEQVRRHPADLRLCLSAEDIVAARSEGKFGVLMGVEGGHSIENDLGLLRAYYRLGVRYMTLTWSNTNDWADSSGDQGDPAAPRHHGLTVFGWDVVREMNRFGMMIDVSHASNETLSEVLEITSAPIIASHSSAQALTAAPRNLSDEWLQAIAFNGGLVMVNFFPAFLNEAWRAAWNAMKPERDAAHATVACPYRERRKPVPFRVSNAVDREFAARLLRPPLSTLIDHIDHIARVAGIDHVGFGSDFDGIPALPEGIDSAADLPRITQALLDIGYSPAAIRKVLGENLLRVFRAVEAAAAPAAR